MAALDRYDEWEASLDTDDHPTLAELYDRDVVAAIESRAGEPMAAPEIPSTNSGGLGARFASRAVGSVAVVSLARGLGTVLDEDPEPGETVEIDVGAHRSDQAVTVFLVAGEPSRSVAVIRRWLL